MRHLFFVLFIILFIISTGLTGCGYKGPPKVPIDEEAIPLEEAKV